MEFPRIRRRRNRVFGSMQVGHILTGCVADDSDDEDSSSSDDSELDEQLGDLERFVLEER